jgi:hypothetical protein
MKPTIKDDCTHAYAGIAVLVAVFMVLFVASTHGQELPNAPRAAVKHQIPPVHKQRLLLAKPGNPDLGSADWFRELGYFRLANFIPVLTRTDWGLSYDKPKETGHGSRKGR